MQEIWKEEMVRKRVTGSEEPHSLFCHHDNDIATSIAFNSHEMGS